MDAQYVELTAYVDTVTEIYLCLSIQSEGFASVHKGEKYGKAVFFVNELFAS